MRIPSYGKIERQTSAYGEQLRRTRFPETEEEREAWLVHSLHVRAGDRYRKACDRARGSESHGPCTCRAQPGFDTWAVAEQALGGRAKSLTYPRLEAIRKAMDEYRADLLRKVEILGRLKLSRARHEHLKGKACIGK